MGFAYLATCLHCLDCEPQRFSTPELRDEWKHVHEDATSHRVVKAAVWQI